MPYLGRKGPYLTSNDTQGAWLGSAMNASCSWLGLNRNITVNSQAIYQRGFQCTYGMQARAAPAAPAPASRIHVHWSEAPQPCMQSCCVPHLLRCTP